MTEHSELHDAKIRHRKTITISTIGSVVAICTVILPTIGWALRGTLVNFMADAMADEIKTQVQSQLEPVNAGLKVLIENTIAELEDQISALEYQQRYNQSTFTQLDNTNLGTMRRRLKSQQDALAAIREAEKTKGS